MGQDAALGSLLLPARLLCCCALAQPSLPRTLQPFPGTRAQLVAENRLQAGDEDVGCTAACPPPRAEWPLSPLSWQLSILAECSAWGCTLPPSPAPGFRQGSTKPCSSEPFGMHVCVLLRSCAGSFWGDHPKMLRFPPPDAALCPVADACAWRALRARAAALPATPARSTAARTGGPACLMPPTTPACALPTTQVPSTKASHPQTSRAWPGRGMCPVLLPSQR